MFILLHVQCQCYTWGCPNPLVTLEFCYMTKEILKSAAIWNSGLAFISDVFIIAKQSGKGCELQHNVRKPMCLPKFSIKIIRTLEGQFYWKKIVTLILTHIRNEVSSTHYMPTLRIPDLYVKDPAKSTEGAMSKSKW